MKFQMWVHVSQKIPKEWKEQGSGSCRDANKRVASRQISDEIILNISANERSKRAGRLKNSGLLRWVCPFGAPERKRPERRTIASETVDSKEEFLFFLWFSNTSVEASRTRLEKLRFSGESCYLTYNPDTRSHDMVH
jgi:hypothetical protein